MLRDPNYINKLKSRKKAKEYNEYLQKKQEEMAENRQRMMHLALGI